MIIVSPIIDLYIKYKLKDKKYRHQIFERIINKELRHKKMGQIILRNVGDVMAANPSFHSEFASLKPNENYQKIFWESDLGYLWYQGNIKTKNRYFELAIEEINKNRIDKVKVIIQPSETGNS